MTIALKAVLPVPNLDDYKVHLAHKSEDTQPLDAFVRDRSEWDLWNRWKPGRNRFNRERIFSLIHFYPETNIWLFGGVYKVISRSPEKYAHSYELELDRDSEAFIGRLKIRFERSGREQSVKLENCYLKMEAYEPLPEPYSGEQFCGYENVNHDLNMLELVFRSNKLDWKTALQNVKGVYSIVDKHNGKKYVGSAYGEFGIWARWGAYMGTGHGGNDDLTRLIDEQGIEYARQHFRLALLEYHPLRTEDSVIIERENHWKEVLLSRGKFGYNRN